MIVSPDLVFTFTVLVFSFFGFDWHLACFHFLHRNNFSIVFYLWKKVKNVSIWILTQSKISCQPKLDFGLQQQLLGKLFLIELRFRVLFWFWDCFCPVLDSTSMSSTPLLPSALLPSLLSPSSSVLHVFLTAFQAHTRTHKRAHNQLFRIRPALKMSTVDLI